MFFIAVILLGIISLRQLAIDLFPHLDYPRLMVRVQYADTPPEQMVNLVTRPIEEAVGNIRGMKKVTSVTRQGLSLINLEFFWGTDMDYASLSVREKLDEVRYYLPDEAERPQILHIDPSAKPVMHIAVGGADIHQLTEVCRNLIRRRLEQLQGVAMVETVGGLEREILVEVDPQKLLVQNITLDQITSSLSLNNLAQGGGTIRHGRYRHSLYIDGEYRTLEEIKQTGLILSGRDHPVRLGDIARVDYVPEERRSITRFNGNEMLGLFITKESGSNTVAVCNQVRTELDRMTAEMPTLRFQIVSEQSEYIQSSIDNLFSNLIWGALLAFVCLILFLQNITHPLTIGISMPVSIISTFIIMHFSGIQLNMMSMGGLALGIGMMVDNSIVVLENIFRLREEGMEPIESCHRGASEVALPVLASTFTTCAVFLPIIYVQGVAGRLFRDYSLTLSFSLLASIITSLLLLPVLISRFRGRDNLRMESLPIRLTYRSDRRPGKSRLSSRLLSILGRWGGWISRRTLPLWQGLTRPVFQGFNRGYDTIYDHYHHFLLYALAHKKTVLLGLGLSLLLTALAAVRLERRLMPPLQQTEYRLTIELPVDATLYQTAEVVHAVESNLLQIPDIESVFSRVGPLESVFQSDEIVGEHQVLLMIRRQSGSTLSDTDLLNRMRESLPKAYSYRSYFESGDLTFTELLGAGGSDLQLDVRGYPSEQLRSVAEQLKEQLRSVNGLKDVHLSWQPGVMQYQIKLDRTRAAIYGVTLNDLTRALKSQTDGLVATRIKEQEKSIDILVRPSPDYRDSWEDIYRRLLNVGGRAVPVSEITQSRIVRAPEHILRRRQQETVQVLANISQVSRNRIMADVKRITDRIQLPSTIRIVPGGEQEEIQSSFRSLRWAFILSIVLIFLILAAQFESLKYPFLIMLSVPYGLIGAVWLLALCGSSLNVISGIGFIVLSGIVINDDIIKVDFINQNRRQGMPVREAILDASRKRFRPIVITTLTTILGVIPMVFSRGNGAELQVSLSLVIIGGLTTGTILTLILIPVFYELFSGER